MCRRWPWRSHGLFPDAPLGLSCPQRVHRAAGLYRPACRASLRSLGAPAPHLLDTYGACPGRPQRTHAWRSSFSPQNAGRRSRRGQRPPCLRDTKLPCKVGKATLAFPGVRVSQISSDTTLVLCQAESLRTHGACSSRPRRGSPVYLGTATPWSTAALPSGGWAAHGARDAPLRERCGRRLPPCGETERPGVGVDRRGGPQIWGWRGGKRTWRNRWW